MLPLLRSPLVYLFFTLSLVAENDWHASWIGVDTNTVNQWTCFRKVFTLDEAPQKAEARIAVDSKYWLWINGEQVVFEGQLKRGPSPQDTYYDKMDLSPHLEVGENTIALLVWYFGQDGFSHKSSGRSGLVFDAEIDGEPILSNRDWKAHLHPAYGDTGGQVPNFRLPESNIRFDAREDLVGWEQPGYDDSAWPFAEELGQPPCAPWNRLLPRPIPMWKDYGLKDYLNHADIPEISNGDTIRLKLPYNAQITPYLEIEAPAGLKIDLRMDNYQGGKANNVRAVYITKEGLQRYESLGWMNGHEMHYTLPEGIRIHALKYRETGYATEFSGSFECDDTFLNQYRQKALRTLYINMRDTYFDCPDRERAQWWGDVVNQMGEAFYALDRQADDLTRKGILELMSWQREDGSIYSPVPGKFDKELPMQMLNSVGYFGFWTYYLYTGDLETIREVYPNVKRYLSLWKIGNDGLVEQRRGGWRWGDWGKNKDMPILYNGWYYLALKGQHEMATVVGAMEDLPEIEAKMQSIRSNFNSTFWNGQEYRSPRYKGQTDDRGHALAVLAGLAQPEQYPAIREVLRKEEHSSPYMEKYVGEALYVMGYPEDAIARTKRRFKEMVEHPYTTLWEDWKIGGSGGGTINHAWSGGALTLLSQYAAGVAPIKPGFEWYAVLPQMGPLKYIKTTMPSVKGDIDLELSREAQAFSMKLSSPENTVAIIGIPYRGDAINEVRANGKVVWGKGKSIQQIEGLSYLEQSNGYIKFRIVPGYWTFEATRETSNSERH